MAFVSGLVLGSTTFHGCQISSRSDARFLGHPSSGRSTLRFPSRSTFQNGKGSTTVMAMERTFLAIKPDGANRALIGEIITRFEKKGYKLVALKGLKPSQDLARTHYDALKSKPFFEPLVNFMCSGLVVAMVWEGKDVVVTARKMIGETNPLSSAPGSIRGDYGVDVGRNVIHGSDAVDTAEREIGIWFKPEELVDWEQTANQWIYE